MKFEGLGDWCKWLEKNFSPEIMIPTLPVIIRLDGNNFSTWTKGLEKPFDVNFIKLMQETTKFLVKETNAVIGYCQSDEITLVLYSEDRKSSLYHQGKKQKILSKLTAKCVNFFNEKRKELLPNHDKVAVFDCRIYQVPTLNDACSQLLWRENDATRNSVLMLGQQQFSHSVLQNLKCDEVKEKLLKEKSVNWDELSENLKRGTYIKRTKVFKPLSKDELDELPPKHQARLNPDLKVERSVISQIVMGDMNNISNRVGVIFFNENPIYKND